VRTSAIIMSHRRFVPAAIGLVILAGILSGCVWNSASPLSRESALKSAAHAPGVVRVARSSAKLMTWQAWQVGSGNRGTALPGPASTQSVWVVALSGTFLTPGRTGPRYMVVVLDDETGNLILETTGSSDWPSYWDSLPDSGPL
jgi:hypothetical protein